MELSEAEGKDINGTMTLSKGRTFGKQAKWLAKESGNTYQEVLVANGWVGFEDVEMRPKVMYYSNIKNKDTDKK